MISIISKVWALSSLLHWLGALLTWLAAVVPGLQVLLTAQIVNVATATLTAPTTPPEGFARLAPPLLLLFSTQVLGRVLAAIAGYCLDRAGLRVRRALALRTMEAGLNLTQADYERPEENNRVRRALQETQSERVPLLPSTVIEFGSSVVSVAAVAVALISWNPVAAVLVLLSPLPGAFAAAVFGRKRWALDTDQMEDRRFASYLQSLTMNDRAHKEVAHLRIGAELRDRFAALLDVLIRRDMSLLRQNHLAVAGADLIGIALTCVALWLVLWSAASTGAASGLGMLAGFVQGVNALYSATLGALGGVAAVYQNSLYARNVFSFIDSVPDFTDQRSAAPSLVAPPTIEARRLTFTYPGTDQACLRDVSVRFPAGLLTVVVGKNGSGKSTLLKLLADVYDVDEHMLSIDGRQRSEHDRIGLRASTGVVFQDFNQFEVSVHDNIAFGDIGTSSTWDSTASRIREVGLEGKVQTLSQGAATRLGRRFADAEQVSAGQWQRLAIARALHANPRILLADEPTAALDAEGETLVVNAIRALRGSATAIVVTHSLAFIAAADQVLFMDEGGRVGNPPAPHETLLRENGDYRTLYEQLRRNADGTQQRD